MKFVMDITVDTHDQKDKTEVKNLSQGVTSSLAELAKEYEPAFYVAGE